MPVTTLLSLSSKSPFIVCSMKIDLDPVTISSLQLVQCLAMSEKGTGGMLKKAGAFLPSSSVYSFLFLLRGYQQHVWRTPSGVVEFSCTLWPVSHQISEVLPWSGSHWGSHRNAWLPALVSCKQVGCCLLAPWLGTSSGWAHPRTSPPCGGPPPHLLHWGLNPNHREGGPTSKFVPSMRTLPSALQHSLKFFILLYNRDFFWLELIILYLKLSLS